MALIIEDGSLLAGANSFVSVAEVRAYASARASILSDDDADVEVNAIKATDYIKSLSHRFKGQEIEAAQALPFPRLYIVVNGFDIPSDSVPQNIKDACCQLAIESAAGVVLMPTTSGQITTKEKVGPLETIYSDRSAPDGTQLFAAVTALLRPFMIGGGGLGSGGGGLSSCRI